MLMPMRTFSISMDERTYRQAKAAADRSGISMSAWMARAATERVQRDAARTVAELDRLSGDDWSGWTEASERDFTAPGEGKGAA